MLAALSRICSCGVEALVPNWRPDDLDNDGVGVLVRYELTGAAQPYLPPSMYTD